jgi:hypothetical protein
MKQQLILAFEQWYTEEFEVGKDTGMALNLDETYGDKTKPQMATYKGDSLVMEQKDEGDEDAMAFIRAKHNVD